MNRIARIATAGLLGSLTLLVATPRQAKADLEFIFDAAASNPLAGTYVYSLQFNSDTVNGVPGEELKPTNFATLYDIAGLTSYTVSNGGFYGESVPIGFTPNGVNPPDDPTLPNITLVYDAVTTVDTTFKDALTVHSTDHATISGYYAGDTYLTSDNFHVGSIGLVAVPGVVPAPPSLILMGLGGLGTGLASIRRKLRRRGRSRGGVGHAVPPSAISS